MNISAEAVARFLNLLRGYPARTPSAMLLLFIFSLLLQNLLLPPNCQGAGSRPPVEAVYNGEPIDLTSSRYTDLFTKLTNEYNFSEQELNTLFNGVTVDERVLHLINSQYEARPYYQYLALFFTPAIVDVGKQKLAEHKDLLERIEQQFGVDREYLIAIWGVETRFGQSLGKYNVFRTLNTLYDGYPRRSAFFGRQLVHFLLLCRENSIDPKSVKGSYAGAFGQTQFIPSSFREYAVSFDGDDKRDVFQSVPDILASIANYLKRSHWVFKSPVYAYIGTELHSQELHDIYSKGRKGKIDWRKVVETQQVDIPRPPGDKPLTIVGFKISPLPGGSYKYFAGYPNFQAITAWNHSNKYAMAVAKLAQAMAD